MLEVPTLLSFVMLIQSTCPHCQNLFEVEAAVAGKVVVCPYCRRSFTFTHAAGRRAGASQAHSGRSQMLVLPGVALLLVAMYIVGVQMRLWPGPDLGSFGGPVATVTVHNAWTAEELPSGIGITQGAIRLSKEARDRGMRFLVIKMTLDGSALDLRRLDKNEVQEMANGKAGPQSKDVDWHRYTLKAGHFRLLKPDGESVLASGFGDTITHGFSQVSSSVISVIQKPKSADLTPFFLMPGAADDLKDLKFQFKEEAAVPITVSAREE